METRWNVADAEPDPAMVRSVRRRAVRAKRVVQRELPGRQLHHLATAVEELLDDRLAGAVDAVLEPQRGALHLARPPLRRGDLHTAGFCPGVAHRHPAGDVLCRPKAE